MIASPPTYGADTSPKESNFENVAKKVEVVSQRRLKIKSVHWADLANQDRRVAIRGILRFTWHPLYNTLRTTLSFAIQISVDKSTFDIMCGARKFQAKMLVVFEQHLLHSSPAEQRGSVKEQLIDGYGLSFRRRASFKCAYTAIRDDCVPFPEAAFVAFLNCVEENAIVRLERSRRMK
jgi:hypothetical protein